MAATMGLDGVAGKRLVPAFWSAPPLMDIAPPDLPSSAIAGEYRPMGRDWAGGLATDVFRRLSHFAATVQQRAAPVWKSAVLQFERGVQWLKLRLQAVFFAAGVGVPLLLLVFSGVTAAVAAVAAWIALIRHFAQTDADRQRRITESFSKAVEQLASDKMTIQMGGIYTLERISLESAEDQYWTVMEILAAFVREQAGWKAPDPKPGGSKEKICEEEGSRQEEIYQTIVSAIERHGGPKAEETEGRPRTHLVLLLPANLHPPSITIVAALSVIARRPERRREREKKPLDLRRTDLRRADLRNVHFERAILQDAHLEWAVLWDAHLDKADLSGAHLDGAELNGAHLKEAMLALAHLEGAMLNGADLQRADLTDSNLTGAHLPGAHLEECDLHGAILEGAHLEGADLSDARGLSAAQLASAYGDAATKLPAGMTRPAHWPATRT